MRDVTVDEAIIYDSVTLQLNLSNGTFTVMDATLKDTPFSETVLDSLSENGLKVDFYGCALSGKNQVTCMTKVVALNTDLQILAVDRFSASKLFDNLSNEYGVSTTTALDKTGPNLSFNIIQGIPVEVKFIYTGINSAATSVSAFQPEFRILTGANTDIKGNFRDIDF